MKIAINNRQGLHRTNRRQLKSLAAYLARQASALSPHTVWNEISIVLTDNAGMQVLNRQLLSKPEPTDVISLGYDPIPGDPAGRDVEIILNVERAAREGSSRRGFSPSRELALYLSHAFDHLIGENDRQQSGRNRMRRRELRWLSRAGKSGLIDGIMPVQRTSRARDKRRMKDALPSGTCQRQTTRQPS